MQQYPEKTGSFSRSEEVNRHDFSDPLTLPNIFLSFPEIFSRRRDCVRFDYTQNIQLHRTLFTPILRKIYMYENIY
jgi:hypothetical protein